MKNKKQTNKTRRRQCPQCGELKPTESFREYSFFHRPWKFDVCFDCRLPKQIIRKPPCPPHLKEYYPENDTDNQDITVVCPLGHWMSFRWGTLARKPDRAYLCEECNTYYALGECKIIYEKETNI